MEYPFRRLWGFVFLKFPTVFIEGDYLSVNALMSAAKTVRFLLLWKTHRIILTKIAAERLCRCRVSHILDARIKSKSSYYCLSHVLLWLTSQSYWAELKYDRIVAVGGGV